MPHPWCIFPRSADRGLIEARNPARNTIVDFNFPDHLIGASLKLSVGHRGFQYQTYFPDQLIGASLKPTESVPILDSLAYFPDQLIGASLKQSERGP